MLLSLMTVSAVAFFLLALLASIRQRRLASAGRGGFRRRFLAAATTTTTLGGRKWEEGEKGEGGGGRGEKGVEDGGGGGLGMDMGYGEGAVLGRVDSGYFSGGGDGVDERGAVLGRVREVGGRVAGMLQVLGRRVSGVSGRVRGAVRDDVEFGYGYVSRGGGEGGMGGQVDGIGAVRETGGGSGWFARHVPDDGPGSGACRLRKRGLSRMSSEGECPV
jgi:hypothetical protein